MEQAVADMRQIQLNRVAYFLNFAPLCTVESLAYGNYWLWLLHGLLLLLHCLLSADQNKNAVRNEASAVPCSELGVVVGSRWSRA